ncbi:MAG: hypothetical protein H5T43_09715 [Methanomethylovorans sp.]|nr:hypothetical protein [Methanomethylovorans sp.]
MLTKAITIIRIITSNNMKNVRNNHSNPDRIKENKKYRIISSIRKGTITNKRVSIRTTKVAIPTITPRTALPTQ